MQVQEIPPLVMIPRWAVFISPHFDDVAFSCGGTLLKRTKANFKTAVCTVFTNDARPMGSFAFECQASKGYGYDVGYLAIRSEEDKAYHKKAGVESRFELGYLEAPYRGYDSLEELFGGVKTQDNTLVVSIGKAIEDLLLSLNGEIELFVPLAIGNHVDHIIVHTAIEELLSLRPSLVKSLLFYEDLPYCIRTKGSYLSDMSLQKSVEDITDFIDKKVELLLLYKSQIENQFGSDIFASIEVRKYADNLAVEEGYSGFVERFFCFQLKTDSK